MHEQNDFVNRIKEKGNALIDTKKLGEDGRKELE